MRRVDPAAAYIKISLVDGAPSVVGRTRADLGHRIPDQHGKNDGGSWVRWNWDGASLTVRNDDLAGYPAFYAVTADSIAVSPSIDRLLSLGTPSQLDLDALAVFLAVGYYVGTDTAFRAIRALPPATTLTWDGTEFRHTTSRMPLPVSSMTQRAAVDGVIERVRAAVSRRLAPDTAPFMMPLSGGRDSRHILLELVRQGRTPSMCVTSQQYPTDWGGDAPYAAQLCAALGIAHQVVQPGPLIAAELRKNRMCSYGADEHAWLLSVIDALAGKTEHTYDGIGGGLLLHRDFMTRSIRQLQGAGRWDELAASLGKKDDGRARFVSLLSPELRSHLTAERAAARIRAELELHLGCDDPYLSFTIWNRTIREIALAPGAMLAEVPVVYAPFLDNEFVTFAASIPDDLARTRLHDEVIATAFPEVAGVPYTPHRRPKLDRAFMRQVDRDLLRLLRRSDAFSLVDQSGLLRRAALGAVRGDNWFAWGRRAGLTTYLLQLGELIHGPTVPPTQGRADPFGRRDRSESMQRRIIGPCIRIRRTSEWPHRTDRAGSRPIR